MKNIATLSNAGYFIGAIISAAAATPYGVAMAFALLYVGTTSAGWHVTGADLWRRLDRSSMYLVAILVAGKLLSIPLALCGVAAVVVAYLAWSGRLDTQRDMIIIGGVSLFAILVRALFFDGSWALLIFALLFFGWAAYIRVILDGEAHEGSFHGLWHFLTGIGLGVLGAADLAPGKS